MHTPFPDHVDGVLDEETLESPGRLTADELFAATGRDWRRRDRGPFDMEDDQ